jgi:soluble epoxide hydrolase/lipid-phosphate phosphatase
MSVPYFPPQKRYIPPNEASKRAPTFAYQEYFADPDSTQEIEANVFRCHLLGVLCLELILFQLDTFLSAIFQAPQSDSVITNTRKTDEGGLPIPVLREGQMQRLVRADVGSFRRPPMVLTLQVRYSPNLSFICCSLLIPGQELEQYKQDFRRDGMHGPLSYYRTTQTRFEEEKGQ